MSPLPSCAAKRAKLQACASCRKSKTRCEILEPNESLVQCHRCKVLALECSYEQSQLPDTESASGSQKAFAGFWEVTSSKGRLWSFVAPDGKDLDWSLPMLAIQQLPNPDPNPTEFGNSDHSLSTILPNERVDYLIQLFDAHYTPWLNFQPIRHSKNPLVDIVCSAVAARHLEGAEGAEPARAQSLEAAQCLLILSLWAPFGGSQDARGWDARTLITAAVYRKPPNARDWLCMGTESTPVSRRTPQDYSLIEFPAVLDARTDLRDVRLGITARLFDTFDRGVAQCLAAGTDVSEWSPKMNGVLENLKNAKRVLLPLPFTPVVLEKEQFYFHVLNIYHDTVRLLLLHRAFWHARATTPPRAPIPVTAGHSAFLLRPGGLPLLAMWARDLLQTSEALLVTALAAPPPLLAAAPDTLFNMVTLSAGFPRGHRHSKKRYRVDFLFSDLSDGLTNYVIVPTHHISKFLNAVQTSQCHGSLEGAIQC
ncbi:hypothetical protein C8R44DRAFT_746970 [Mycena epipterygia]|nr:hypothetical protein C8R44DRAFT_746970 [Mycena epipterygia]